MKILLFTLKLFATTAIVTPAATQCGYRADMLHNFSISPHTLNQKYTIDPQWLDTNLLDDASKLVPQERFSNFHKITNIGKITNDDASKTNDKNGAPYIRFGGGLFFDHTLNLANAPASLTPKDKTTLLNSVFSTNGFVSIQNTQKNPKEALNNNTVMTNDYYASESDGKLNHTRTYPHTLYFSKDDWNQNINFDFSKIQTPSSYINTSNDLSSKLDLDLTPTYLQKTSITSDNISQMKKTFLILFNDELSYWYWTTWGSQYDDYMFADQMETKYNSINNALIKGKYIGAPRLNLSLSYNKLVSQTHAIPWWARAAKSFGNLAVDAATAGIDGLGSFANAVLDFFLPDYYTSSKSQPNLLNYYSRPLGYGFWLGLFNKYLGTPASKTGLINQFINQYHELPSRVNLNDFDFYIPYSNINIQSQFTWHTTSYDEPDGPTYFSNKSTSSINLSSLQLKMGTSFTLTRQDSDLANFLNKLQSLPQSDFNFFASDFKKNSEGKYDSNYIPNQQRIIERLDVNLPNYQAFNDFLSFTGELKVGQTTNIEVFYNGEDQHITIPIKVLND